MINSLETDKGQKFRPKILCQSLVIFSSWIELPNIPSDPNPRISHRATWAKAEDSRRPWPHLAAGGWEKLWNESKKMWKKVSSTLQFLN